MRESLIDYCYRLAGVLGVEPRPWTLRKLKVCADAKRQHDFDLMISVACYVTQAFGGNFKPKDANPYRRSSIIDHMIRNKNKSDEERKHDAIEAKQMMRIGLSQIAAGLRHG